MDYRRWAIVGFVGVLVIFSFWHLSTAGSDYQSLTTSDSGFFYGIARDINQEDGMIENYELSHPPNGQSVSKGDQLHPLMLVAIYRGVDAINPGSTSLMDVAQYYAPIIFILALIGIFLAGREIGGNVAGCVAMLFLAVNVYLIYWVKMGAFDREPTQIFFIAWSLYFFAKLFKVSREDIIKYTILSGVVLGLFISSWKGALFMGPAIALALFLALLFELPSKYTSVDKIENAIFHTIRDNLHLIGGVVGAIAVSSVVAIILGGYSPDFWIGLSNRVGSFLGFAGGGGGGISSPIIAAEQNPPVNFLSSLSTNTFNNDLLFNASLVFAALGVIKTFLDRKRNQFLLLAVLLTTLAMSTAQSRFFRLVWPVWPVVAGLGIAALLGWGEKLMTSLHMITSDWSSKAKQPIALSLVFVVLITPFFHNARKDVSDEKVSQTYVYPHGSSLGHPAYFDIVSCFEWLKDTPEDAITAIEWSYGHFLTGYSGRATICDGGQTAGVWNDESMPPPGIVWKDVDGDGIPDDTNGDGKMERTGEGRRRLVSRLQYAAPEKFAKIIENFKNWGIGIDYMVFDLRKEVEALASNIENSKKPDNYSLSAQGMIQYRFGDLVVYFSGQQAFIQKDNSFREVPIMYEVYRRTRQGVRAVHRIVGDFDPRTDLHKTLMLYYRDGGFSKQRQGPLMLKSKIPLATFGKQNIPIVTRILENYEIPPYLKVEHMGSNQKFCVAKINY